MQMISQQDRTILRSLASKQQEVANSPINLQRIKEWKDHNNFRGQRPMIHLELYTFMQEVIEPRLLCETPLGRKIEASLYSHFLNLELFDDDKIVPNYFPVEWQISFTPLGLKEQVSHASDGGIGHHFDPIIVDLEDDFEKFGASIWEVDREATDQYFTVLEDCFGDILPIKRITNCLYSVPTQKMVHFMGMENMLYNICDYPDLFKKVMQKFVDDTIAFFRWMEKEKLLLPTVGDERLNQGSLCYTEELPGLDVWKQRPFTSRDCWGFMDSQETVGMSPQMFEEFIFPYYKQIAEQFGLLSYGCCEPVHTIWENCISKLPNLRKVSISPWCDEEYMGEQLRDKKIIFHRKPSPNYLGVEPILDEDAFRKHIRHSLLAARGCKMEITQRDVYTIHNNIEKARRYVAIIREEIADHWE